MQEATDRKVGGGWRVGQGGAGATVLPLGMSKKRDWLKQAAVIEAVRFVLEKWGAAMLASAVGFGVWVTDLVPHNAQVFLLIVVIAFAANALSQHGLNWLADKRNARFKPGVITRGNLSMKPPHVPESQLIGIMDAVRLVQETWPVTRSRARDLVLRWWWRYRKDSTRWQDGRIVKSQFIPWFEEELRNE